MADFDMHNIDIVIYAAIAAFVIARLWMVLGRRNNDEPQRPNPFVAPLSVHDDEHVMVLDRKKKPDAPNAAITGSAPESLAGAIERVQQIDNSFDEKKFLQDAKIMFAKVVDAFAKGDLTPVINSLSPQVIGRFMQAIAARKAAGQTLENRVDRIAYADVSSVQTEGNVALLTVHFTSNQMNVLRDADGKIISGVSGKAEEIRDEWVFSRDLKAKDSAWQIVETR